MMRSAGIRLVLGWVALLVAGFSVPVAGAEAPKLELAGARVLVCHGYWDLLNLPLVHRMKAAGAEVRHGSLSALTAEEARKYHLIIVVASDPPEGAAGERAIAALEEFVRAGGGLLFFRSYYAAEAAERYLEPLGAGMPWEVIQDPAHAYRSPLGFNMQYAYTDRVTAGHPVTEGVRTVWYNAAREMLFHTSPVQVGQEWQVLVTGMPQASSGPPLRFLDVDAEAEGTYQSAPPIVAAREYGEGAAVLVGITHLEVLLGQGLPAYVDVAMEKGNGMIPSDTGRLYVNAVNWLAARAQGQPQVGVGELEPVVNSWAVANVPDWSQPVLTADACTDPIRGVIGLHSSLSDGRVTPQALIEKARALGLDWIAFTERLEEFSPEKWAELRRVCREASTPQFAVLPGLDYADNAGARYVAFGDFDWPPAKVFSDDGKRIIEPQWWFTSGPNWAPIGPYDAGSSPLKPWDYSMYNMWPVRTTIGGRQVDEAVEAYRYVQGIHDDPFPMAVEMVYDEAELEAAAGRMGTYVMMNQPGDLTDWFRRHAYYASSWGFVSEGPVVTDWRAHNETRVSGGQWWVPGTEQYRVKLSVRSAAPITDIRIYDGPNLFRRFRPDQAQVTLTFDVPHDMQRQLFAEITDAEGKQAITGGISVRDWLNWRFMCADRGNSICDAVIVDEYGAYMTGPSAPYHRKMTAFGLAAGRGERHFVGLPPDFDGGMRPVGMHITPWLTTPDLAWKPVEGPLQAKQQMPVASRDGILQGNDLVGVFPANTDAWSPKYPPLDLEGLWISQRFLNITPRAHDPGVILYEGAVHFERDAKLDSAMVYATFHSTQPGEGDHFLLHTPSVTVAGISAAGQYSRTAVAAPGSYAVAFPSLWGSTGPIILDEGYRLTVAGRPGNTHMGVNLEGLPREFKAGESLEYRFVLMQGPAGELPNTDFWERFVERMGIRGAPAYQVTAVEAGEVRGTRFLLELGPSEGGFRGTVSGADLPIRLPVRVAEMNPNWTCAWFDLDRKEWYPSAVDPMIRQGYFTLDTRRGAHRIFAGHPVLAGDPELRIAALSDGRSRVEAEVNNVGDAPVTTVVRLNPALGDAPPQELTLAPGELRRVVFEVEIN